MDNDDLNIDKVDLPKCAEDPPPQLTPPKWLDSYLSMIGDAFFCAFCVIVIIGFFMFVGFGLQYFLTQYVPYLLP